MPKTTKKLIINRTKKTWSIHYTTLAVAVTICKTASELSKGNKKLLPLFCAQIYSYSFRRNSRC